MVTGVAPVNVSLGGVSVHRLLARIVTGSAASNHHPNTRNYCLRAIWFFGSRLELCPLSASRSRRDGTPGGSDGGAGRPSPATVETCESATDRPEKPAMEEPRA